MYTSITRAGAWSHRAIATVIATIGLSALAAQAASVPEPTVKQPVTAAVPGDFDPYYNACRGTNPLCYHPWVSNRLNKVLLFTRTTGPRHVAVGTPLGPGINPPLNANNSVQAAVVAWMTAVGVQVDYTEDVTRLTNLNQYKAVIFALTSRDALTPHGRLQDPVQGENTTNGANLDAARYALRQYIRAGGGFAAIHEQGTETEWTYFEGLRGGGSYYEHGADQLGDAVVVQADSSTNGLPARFSFKDEYGVFMPYPTRVKFLLRVDDSTLANLPQTHPGHGAFHPVTWCQYYDGGRSWVTSLGHELASWTDGSNVPGQQQFKQHVVNGILSAMGNIPFCETPSAK